MNSYITWIIWKHIFNVAKIDPALTLLHMPDGHLKEEELQHPQAKEIGCSEDYDAWRDGEVNPKPAEFPGTLRTVGKIACPAA